MKFLNICSFVFLKLLLERKLYDWSDGKGKFRNEFGIMERCESCQGAEMTFAKIDPDDDYILNSFHYDFGVNYFIHNLYQRFSSIMYDDD